MDSNIGRIVKSCAGRDKDTFLVIIRCEGDFAYLADGGERPLDRPKKKRIKHLKFTNTFMDMDAITDKKLRCAVRSFNENLRK